MNSNLQPSPLSSIGFSDDTIKIIEKIEAIPKKGHYVIVAGQSYSGKTTTLKALIDHFSNNRIRSAVFDDGENGMLKDYIHNGSSDNLKSYIKLAWRMLPENIYIDNKNIFEVLNTEKDYFNSFGFKNYSIAYAPSIVDLLIDIKKMNRQDDFSRLLKDKQQLIIIAQKLTPLQYSMNKTHMLLHELVILDQELINLIEENSNEEILRKLLKEALTKRGTNLMINDLYAKD